MEGLKTMITKYFLFLLVVLSLLTFVNAEVYMWTDINILDSSSSYYPNTVNEHSYFQFDDTSLSGVGKNKEIQVDVLYTTQALPFNWSSDTCTGVTINTCYMNVTLNKNIYDFFGNLINTSVEYYDYSFTPNVVNSGRESFYLKSRDSIIVDMRCEYSNEECLYDQNILFATYDLIMPSFQCDQCSQYTLEELSNMQSKNENMSSNQDGIFEKMNLLVGWNYKFWTILSWIIKIFFILGSVILIFSGVYWIYKYLENFAREIK